MRVVNAPVLRAKSALSGKSRLGRRMSCKVKNTWHALLASGGAARSASPNYSFKPTPLRGAA